MLEVHPDRLFAELLLLVLDRDTPATEFMLLCFPDNHTRLKSVPELVSASLV